MCINDEKGTFMSAMKNLVMDMMEMAEQGFSAFSIAAKLNVPLNWAEEIVDELYELEQQKQQEMMGYEDVE